MHDRHAAAMIATNRPQIREWNVVAVIDDQSEAGGAPYIEFKVVRSADDPDLIVGSWQFRHDQSAGRAVLTEFRYAVDCADQHGIAFVWVNDPEELFPPWERR
jgi:uncharacterized protein YbaA (DUF1428 family)